MRTVQDSCAIRVNIYYSPVAHKYKANSPDLDGLAASGGSVAEVEQQAQLAAEKLFKAAGISVKPVLYFHDANFPLE